MKKRRITLALTVLSVTALAVIFSYACHFFIRETIAQPAMLASAHGIYERTQAPLKDFTEYRKPPILTKEDEKFEEVPDILFFEIAENLARSIPKGMVALTFDDGPSAYTKEIVDTLKKHNVGGTFFLVGSNLAKFPGKTEYIHENGFTIGSHSINHVDFSKSNWNTQYYELQKSSEMIKAITGEEISLFRPPYGQYNSITENVTSELGHRIILWDNDPKDWLSRDAEQIIHHIKSSRVSGSIIILHEYAATLEALPEIIRYLKEQNLQLVTLR